MKSFFRFFAEGHILANLLIIMIILLGVNTLMQINRNLYPVVDYGTMVIRTIYPGASPEDVELNVTNKIEDELKNVSGVDKMTSVSMENASVITVIFDSDVKDLEKVKDDIREAVGQVTDFPAEVTEAPHIDERQRSFYGAHSAIIGIWTAIRHSPDSNAAALSLFDSN